jgi:hypothetical protein
MKDQLSGIGVVRIEALDSNTSKLYVKVYKPSTPYDFPIGELASYLEKTLGKGLADDGVQVRDEFIQNYIVADDDQILKKQFAEMMAGCRLEDIQVKGSPVDNNETVRVFFSAMELNLLEGIQPDRAKDFMYHGARLMDTFRRFLPEEEWTIHHIHLVFTDRLFFSWSDLDARYHARASMMGFPHLISMPGLVEAPARPREYYIKRHLYAASGLDTDELEAEFAGQYLIYKDARTLEILKGYALQSIFYTLFMEPFCDDPDCRLFNAHWQAELLNAQVDLGKLCDRHQKMLDDWLDQF